MNFDVKASIGRGSLRLMCLPLMASAMLVTLVQAQTHSIYPAVSVAPAQIKAALVKADKEHKRVILDFGGDWCGDCKVLDSYLHKSPNSEILAKYFVLVHVNIGQFDKNLDIARKVDVPLKLGVPALAILDSKGKVLLSQKHGEFESMQKLDSNSVTKFLNEWKSGSKKPN